MNSLDRVHPESIQAQNGSIGTYEQRWHQAHTLGDAVDHHPMGRFSITLDHGNRYYNRDRKICNLKHLDQVVTQLIYILAVLCFYYSVL